MVREGAWSEGRKSIFTQHMTLTLSLEFQAETEPATKKQRLDNALKQRLDDLWISLQQVRWT